MLNTAIQAALEAGRQILEVYNRDFHVEWKADQSPLTEADRKANEVIMALLAPTGIPVISEEHKQTDYAERSAWTRCWLVDPLDGTKEFIKKNGEFTVNIALVEQGRPLLGVVYVPVSGDLYFGVVADRKAYKAKAAAGTWPLSEIEAIMQTAAALQPARKNPERIRVVGSRSHMSAETMTYIQELEKTYREVALVSRGSSLKFCLVAEGLADVYPRFAPTMEWDTAAGQAVCEAAGLNVVTQDGKERMQYNKANLLNPYFLVAIADDI